MDYSFLLGVHFRPPQSPPAVLSRKHGAYIYRNVCRLPLLYTLQYWLTMEWTASMSTRFDSGCTWAGYDEDDTSGITCERESSKSCCRRGRDWSAASWDCQVALLAHILTFPFLLLPPPPPFSWKLFIIHRAPSMGCSLVAIINQASLLTACRLLSP